MTLPKVVVGVSWYVVTTTTSRDVERAGWFVSGVINFRLEHVIITSFPFLADWFDDGRGCIAADERIRQ